MSSWDQQNDCLKRKRAWTLPTEACFFQGRWRKHKEVRPFAQEENRGWLHISTRDGHFWLFCVISVLEINLLSECPWKQSPHYCIVVSVTEWGHFASTAHPNIQLSTRHFWFLRDPRLHEFENPRPVFERTLEQILHTVRQRGIFQFGFLSNS